jgi:branched-chain amino acid transport system permease protein
MKLWLVRLIGLVLGTGLLYGVSFLMWDNIEEYWFTVIVLCGIYIILAVSLNLVNGITGQFSIGHAGFYAVGAYAGAAWGLLILPNLTLSDTILKVGTLSGDVLNMIISMLFGGLCAGIMGYVVGLPSLRLRGDYLAIVTLGFGEMIRILILNIDALGGARGMNGIPNIIQSGGIKHLPFFWTFGIVVLVILVSRNLLTSVRGLTFLAVREDEIAADAMGVNTTKVKVTAFVIGAIFAGFAGALFAPLKLAITTDTFNMDTSIIITTMVVLGGTGSITGSVLAAILLTALPEWLRGLQEYRMIVFSTLLIVMMLTRPQGLFGKKEVGLNLFRRRKSPVITEGGAA